MDRLCKDCRWVRDTERFDGEYAKCSTPRNMTPTGFGADARIAFCSSHRGDGWLSSITRPTCGRRGRWWEPKAEEA